MSGSTTPIARAGLAVAIRQGAPAPDLSTPAAFTSALLAARRVSYSDPTAGGSAAAYFAKLLERLGIAAAVNAKATLGRNGHHVAELVADGTAELGISFLSELVAIKGVAIAGPLPAELQNYTVYAGAIPRASRLGTEAKALLASLTRAGRRRRLARGRPRAGGALTRAVHIGPVQRRPSRTNTIVWVTSSAGTQNAGIQ